MRAFNYDRSNRFRCAGTYLAAAVLCLLTASFVAEATPAPALMAIVHATVIHPELPADKAQSPDSTVIVAGNRIQAVGPSTSTRVPAGARIIDARGQWVTPGLIDGHVHFFQSGNLYTRPDIADFNRWMPYSREVARNQARLADTFRVWLASGVTSVVDVGGPLWNFQVRDAARSSAAAPRVSVAGPLISMVARPQLDLGDPPIIKVESPDAARALVARLLSYRPDYIKVWFIHRAGDDLAAQEAIVKAAGDAAHAARTRLAVHATELVTAKAALRAGADYLVHSVEDEPVDEEFLSLVKSRDVLYCPTLFVRLGYVYALSNTWEPTDAERRLADAQILAAMHDLDRIPKDLVPERVLKLMQDKKAPSRPTVAFANLTKVWNAGVPVVMGTDAGNIGTLHGPSIFREMAMMVEAGLTPLQVLKSATVNGAAATGNSAEIGTIAAGKLADLVIVNQDPLADIVNMSSITHVIKDGKEFAPADLLRGL
jgi:imidazolonepropionase-like amidohydrolase